MLNPTAWNWGAKSGFFWAGLCFICLNWTYFRLPEPKGRTYGEIDILFERRVSARKFKGTVVNEFEDILETPSSNSNTAKNEKRMEVQIESI
jgi:SP family general alpha glucoside:H+ symporter-like MFS transporter